MSVWNKVPLEDYEKHMSHPSVGQLGLLSEILKERLVNHQPESLAIWGIAGGNGLEHIDNTITRQVVGIDINQKYLDECAKRFDSQIPALILYNCDLNNENRPVIKASFIWGALIFEYIDIHAAFKYAIDSLDKNGVFSIVIQKNNGVTSVSNTHVESVKEIGSIFNVVDIEKLKDKASESGFQIILEKEYFLPNGKSFIALDMKL